MRQQPVNQLWKRASDWVRIAFCCLIMSSASNLLLPVTAHARAIPHFQTRALPKCEVYDANPKFISPELAEYLSNRPGTKVSKVLSAALFSNKLHERTGSVADGESRLLLKKEVPMYGRVSWRVVGEAGAKHGTCEPLFGGWTVVHQEKCYGFALYTPPKEFGPYEGVVRAMDRGLVVGGRPVKVEITWEDVDVRLFPPEVETHGPVTITMGDARVVATYGTCNDERELWLARPPVVLVHGTYDNGHDCWAWGKTRPDGREDKHYTKAPNEYQTKNLKGQLEAHGFSVYPVNFKRSNGMEHSDHNVLMGGNPGEPTAPALPSSSSHFRDNEKVVWDGGRIEDPNRGKGIRAALEEFRGNGIAATQADVVGHSMGGVLARVYAEGRHLDYTVRQSAENWYRRPDNFQAGDINRLITIGSTHLGSHISGFLQHYSYYAETNPANGVAKTPPSPVLAATLRNTDLFSSASALGWVYWGMGNMVSSRFPRGAFTDQIPGSKALMGILSPNPVAVHAIACVATVADLDLFQGIQGKKGLYRTQMEMIWDYTPGWFLCEILRNRLIQPEDADILQEILREIEELKENIREAEHKIPGIDDEWLTPRPSRNIKSMTQENKLLFEKILEYRKDLERLEEKGKLRLIAAIFGNDYSDFTVSLSSQLGGLKKPYVTIIPADYRTAKNGVLHSYEPRHKIVQARVIELLIGGMEPFDSNGFPAIRYLPSEGRPPGWPPGWPAYYAPSKGEAFKPYEQLP